MKFDTFLDMVVVQSSLKKEQIKDEIAKYVKAMETNYNDTIRVLKEKSEKLLRQVKVARSEKVNDACEKSDMEQLFVDCIEEVRKEVMRRRFRTEVANRKSTRIAQRSSTGNHDGAKGKDIDLSVVSD